MQTLIVVIFLLFTITAAASWTNIPSSLCSRRSSLSSPSLLQLSSKQGRRRRRRQKGKVRSEYSSCSFSWQPSCTVSPSDIEIIQTQLGYIPTNLLSISARALDEKQKNQRPIAIKTYPLRPLEPTSYGNNDNDKKSGHYHRHYFTPFPTLYWLTCPFISKAISELERRGYVRIFEQRLYQGHDDDDDDEDEDKDEEKEGQDYKQQWLKCHEMYARDRWMTLSEQHRNYLLGKQQLEEQQQEEVMKIGNQLSSSLSSSTTTTTFSKKAARTGMLAMLRDSGVAGIDCTSSSSSSTVMLGIIGDKDLCDQQEKQTNHDTTTMMTKSRTLKLPSIKCLHAHYAHYRSSGRTCNIVGEWTHELLRKEFPRVVL